MFSKFRVYFKTEDLPPSTGIIDPVVQALSGESRNVAAFAESSGFPRRGKGWVAATAEAIFSLSVIGFAMADPPPVKLGATQFTRMDGASSAANDTVRPSTAALLDPMTA
mmetsp:Transcript_20178/g.19425  ORF Transcript_20178/g.19425 Transcript_20178/m.19425 type:complete len:110 (+) Transcript_20178:60-389(+)